MSSETFSRLTSTYSNTIVDIPRNNSSTLHYPKCPRNSEINISHLLNCPSRVREMIYHFMSPARIIEITSKSDNLFHLTTSDKPSVALQLWKDSRSYALKSYSAVQLRFPNWTTILLDHSIDIIYCHTFFGKSILDELWRQPKESI